MEKNILLPMLFGLFDNSISTDFLMPFIFGAVFMSLFYAALIYSYANKSMLKFSFTKFLIFRIIILLIVYGIFGETGIIVDFFIIWFSGAVQPFGRFITKLCRFETKTLDQININTENDSHDFLRCSRCNRIINKFDRVCPGCGEHTENYDALGICTKCNNRVSLGNEFCPNCGKDLKLAGSYMPMNKIPIEFNENYDFLNNNTANNSAVETNTTKKLVVFAKTTDYNQMYLYDEQTVLKNFINKEMEKANYQEEKRKLPKKLYRRKIILNILFAILLFFFVALLFFHLDFWKYLIYLIVLIIIFILGRKFSLVKYFMKEVKSRPNEKISNIVISTKNDLVRDKSILILLIGMILSIVIPLLYFKEPRLFYELNEDKTGYVVRFYTFGLSDNETINIPKTYNGKPVVGIRGDVFKNLVYLKEVTLPESITEIRGYAFANDTNLVSINIPENLSYLGGGAFENCESLVEIILPESLEEIRGDTFRNCTSLEKINIPDKVTRIGGHAFHGCSSLHTVDTTEKSSLIEIGSSAFRDCYNLRSITLPKITNVNERAFKGSGTRVLRYGQNTELSEYEPKVIIPEEKEIEQEQIIEEPIKEEKPVVEEKKEPVVEQPKPESISTDDDYFNIEYRQIVKFNKYNITLNYLNINNNIATLVFDYNGKKITVDYDLTGNTYIHYLYNDFDFRIKKLHDKKIYVNIYKMIPSKKGYNYYVNLTVKDNSEYEIISNNFNKLKINFENLKDYGNDKYSMDFVLSGTVNKRITLTSENNTFTGDNFFLESSYLWEIGGGAVIFIK